MSRNMPYIHLAFNNPEFINQLTEGLRENFVSRLFGERSPVPISVPAQSIPLDTEMSYCAATVARLFDRELSTACELSHRFVTEHHVTWQHFYSLLLAGHIVHVDNKLVLNFYNRELFEQIEAEYRRAVAFDQDEITTSNPSVIGNLECEFNARSLYIRCAVNPCGPCENCTHFKPLE